MMFLTFKHVKLYKDSDIIYIRSCVECFVIFFLQKKNSVQDANKHMLRDNDSDESNMVWNAGSSEENFTFLSSC